MPVQTAYSTVHNALYAGQLASMQIYNIVSKLNKSTTVTIPWGYGVVSDGDDGAKLPISTSTAAKFVGIVQRELNNAYPVGVSGVTASFGAVPIRSFAVITEGEVAVVPHANVAKDDPVYLIVGDGTGTFQGEFSNVVGTAATTAVLIPNAKWLTTTTAGQVGKLSLVIGG